MESDDPPVLAVSAALRRDSTLLIPQHYSRTRFRRSKKGCPALVGKSAVVTHSGDPCRAAGLLPIAMGLKCTGFDHAGTRPETRLLPRAA